ncbi:MAG TPA: MMPL family transporter [Gemmatimonadaceae bacterium]|nr:MMPL family transporter [Gemmatimonadaceae bacterium]
MAGSEAAARGIVRRRRTILAAWIVLCAALVPAARSIESVLSVAARIDGSESAAVDDQLARRFRSPFAHSVVLVAAGLPSPTTRDGESALGRLATAVKSEPGVTGVVSYLDGRESLMVADSGQNATFLMVGLDGPRPDTRLALLRDDTRRIEREMHDDYPHLELRWTGETALNADLRRASAADAQSAELRALPLTLLLLLVAFGALAAALLPIAGGMLAIGVSLGLASLVAHVWSLSILAQNVVTMIGLGLGIDYSLLMVGRFRDELRSGRRAEVAAVEALRHAGPTIALSGLAVAIGFGALVTAPVNELRSVAIGGLLVTGVSILISTTLLPGLLAEVGERVDLGRVNLVRRARPRWNHWADAVTRHPLRVLAICGLPVCALAWQSRKLNIDLPRGDWLPKQMESAVALRSLQTMGRGSVVNTIRLTLEFPRGMSALDDSGWAATTRVARWLVADSAIQRVRSLPGFVAPMGTFIPRDTLVSLLPASVRRSFVSEDGGMALLEVVPRESATPRDLSALVHRLRSADTVLATSRGRATLLVGGLPAFNYDYERAVAGRLVQVIALVVGATFIVLAVGFRSVLVPLKAIVLNLLAVAAAFGAVKLVFQDGVGGAALGLDGALDAIFPAVPVLVFCIVFGLSMDYEVFLVARIREARAGGLKEREAIAHGLSQTSGLITSAAAIMIVVFGAFVLGDFLLIKMLGFALAVAVLLDATVMRLAVSPALLTLAGRLNWWPGDFARRALGGPGSIEVGRNRLADFTHRGD